MKVLMIVCNRLMEKYIQLLAPFILFINKLDIPYKICHFIRFKRFYLFFLSIIYNFFTCSYGMIYRYWIYSDITIFNRCVIITNLVLSSFIFQILMNIIFLISIFNIIINISTSI